MLAELLTLPIQPAADAPLVLLLEPHADTREMMRAWLGHHGFRCAEPADDEGDLSALARVRPDAVLITSPAATRDLAEVAALVRAAGRRRLAVALITPVVDAALLERARDAGAAGCFEKPVPFPELLTLLQTAATPSSSRRPESHAG